jgi:hypothetical protein
MRLLPRLFVLLALLAATGCALQPFQSAPPPTGGKPAAGGQGPVIIPEPPSVSSTMPAEPVIEAPAPSIPVPRERPKVAPASLSPASKALVSQAQAQRKKGDLPGAATTLDRALRMDQRNYAQAEAMGRKALSMAVGDGRTQSAAWVLIADSLRARGKNPQAEEAMERSREAVLR